MSKRPDTAALNHTPQHIAAVRAGQIKRWAKHRTADVRASRLTEKRAKPTTTTQAEIAARAAAKRAARAAAREAASIAAPMTFTDWKCEYQLWAADLRAGGYVGPSWAIFLPRDRLALANARLGLPPPAPVHPRRGELANDDGHKRRRAMWADCIAGLTVSPANGGNGSQPPAVAAQIQNSGPMVGPPAGRTGEAPSGRGG